MPFVLILPRHSYRGLGFLKSLDIIALCEHLISFSNGDLLCSVSYSGTPSQARPIIIFLCIKIKEDLVIKSKKSLKTIASEASFIRLNYLCIPTTVKVSVEPVVEIL